MTTQETVTVLNATVVTCKSMAQVFCTTVASKGPRRRQANSFYIGTEHIVSNQNGILVLTKAGFDKVNSAFNVAGRTIQAI